MGGVKVEVKSHLAGCLGLAVRDWERVKRDRVGREQGVEPRARLLPKPATFLHPESQEMGGVR